MEISISQAQKQVDEWIKIHGLRYFSELTNLGILMEEAGELARVMVRDFGEQSWREPAPPDALSEEMADLLWVLICLANQTGVNLEKAFQDSMNKKTARDHQRHHQNPKLKPGFGEADQS